MNLHHLEAIALVQKLAFALPEKYFAKVEVAVLVPFTALRSVQALIEGDKLLIHYGAQDLSPKDSGPYTGDVSGTMLAKLDCSYVIAGHSERREHHGEDDATVGAKVRAALRNGLVPILCVGEGLEIREAGDHLAHSTAQLRAAVKGLSAEQARTTALLKGFEASLRAAVTEQDRDQQLSFADLDSDERTQLVADRAAWQQRLDALPSERDAELAAIARRYATVQVLWFPAAVVHLFPARGAR